MNCAFRADNCEFASAVRAVNTSGDVHFVARAEVADSALNKRVFLCAVFRAFILIVSREGVFTLCFINMREFVCVMRLNVILRGLREQMRFRIGAI